MFAGLQALICEADCAKCPPTPPPAPPRKALECCCQVHPPCNGLVCPEVCTLKAVRRMHVAGTCCSIQYERLMGGSSAAALDNSAAVV